MRLDSDIVKRGWHSHWPASITVMLSALVYFYWQYDWKGVVEVIVLSTLLINMTEKQYRAMVKEQRGRDRL